MSNAVRDLSKRPNALHKLAMPLCQTVARNSIERERAGGVPRHECTDFVNARADEGGDDLFSSGRKLRAQRRLLLVEQSTAGFGEANGGRRGSARRFQRGAGSLSTGCLVDISQNGRQLIACQRRRA